MADDIARVVTVGLGERAYEVRIGSGLLAGLGDAVRRVAPATKALLVSDRTVFALYGAAVRKSLRRSGYDVAKLVVPAGEASKSLAQLKRVWDAGLKAQADRHTPLIALGGGVVGDLGGFAAATLLRGVPFIQVPTSLEAAVDASVGGKTAINHPRGKNLLGAFHQPRLVLHDTDTLGTLDGRDLRAALAESIKHGVIQDAAFFAWHEQHAAELAGPWGPAWAALAGELVERNVQIKARVVEQDERESNLRAILNFGHTIGHAVEAWSLHHSASPLRHGEAVALGMVAAVRLAAARRRLSDPEAARFIALIARVGLPTRLPEPMPTPALLELVGQDKKMAAGKLTFVLPVEVGRVELVRDVTAGELTAAIESLAPAA